MDFDHPSGVPGKVPRSIRVAAVMAVALLGIAASILIAMLVESRERRLLEVQVDHRSHDRTTAIELQLQSNVTHVESIAGLFTATPDVQQKQFQSFAGFMLEHEPALRALSYNVLVRREERAAHEKASRRSYPDYRITESAADGALVRADERPEHVAVTLIEPFEGNEAALGFDIASDPARREALDRARDSGQAAITEPVTLVQERGEQLGALICVPIYRGPTPGTIEARRQRLQGFAVGVIRIGDLVSHALAGLAPAGIHLRIHDASAPGDPRPVHIHRSRTQQSPDPDGDWMAEFRSEHSQTHDVDIAGRRWIIEAAPTAALVAGHKSWTPLALLLGGLLATLAMIVYLVRQAATSARLRSAMLERMSADERRAGLGRVLDESHEEIYVFHAETLRFLHANRGARDNLGYTTEELRCLTPLDLKPRMPRDSFSAMLQPLRQGEQGKINFTTIHRRKDGSLYDVEVHLQMTVFDAGPAFVAVIMDITDRKQVEERRQQSQRLEALGTLAGGTAHDVNNLLTAIMGYAEMSLEEAPRDGVIRGYLDEVIKASERARDVVRQILTFSRRQPIATKSFDLGDVVRETLNLMRASISATVTIHEELADACFVRGDSSQIHQVLMNLCTNAVHAMRGGDGNLSVIMDAVDLSAAEAAQLGDVNSGSYVRICVRDDGTGMPPDVRKRIFDPFFTTKAQGEGTGMGLAVAHGIVTGHKGTIHVSSEVDRGTLFSVYLPRVDSLAHDASDSASMPMANGERIIVVDDEPSIAQLLSEMLSGSGYVVETLGDGSTALEVLSERAGDFDLVVTDYSMPRMTGTTLAREIRRLFPELPVILVSGYGDLIDQDEIRHSGIQELLTKPLRRHELHSAIYRALDRRLV